MKKITKLLSSHQKGSARKSKITYLFIFRRKYCSLTYNRMFDHLQFNDQGKGSTSKICKSYEEQFMKNTEQVRTKWNFMVTMMNFQNFVFQSEMSKYDVYSWCRLSRLYINIRDQRRIRNMIRYLRMLTGKHFTEIRSLWIETKPTRIN